LVVWAVIVQTWGDVIRDKDQEVPAILYMFGSILYLSPLFLILFFDGLKTMSRGFRIGLPVAYVLYVSGLWFFNAYVPNYTSDINGTSVPAPPTYLGNADSESDTISYYASGLTAQGQLATTLWAILVVMFNFIKVSLKYLGNGKTIHFPITFDVLKESVEMALHLEGQLDNDVLDIAGRLAAHDPEMMAALRGGVRQAGGRQSRLDHDASLVSAGAGDDQA
jgi:hypothetical protein